MKVNILVLVKSVLKYFEVMEQGVCNFQKKFRNKRFIYMHIYIYREKEEEKRKEQEG